MATTNCTSGTPQPHPAPARGNPNPPWQPPAPQPCSGPRPAAPNPGHQGGPGPQTSTQDPYPGLAAASSHPHHHILPQHRPYFYLQPAPMPPPFLQCQWPMPFPYNPFSGLPGMGYGMVMPPFPPNPFMGPPGYILPHLQPVDYRHFHPQYTTVNSVYQSQNQHRRFQNRPQQNSSAPRETVNSEVQTEPQTRISAWGSPLAGSDSGRGANSSVPSSPGSSAERRGGPEQENPLPSNGPKTNVLDSGRGQGMGITKCISATSPSRTKTVQSHSRTPLKLQRRRKGSFGWENGAAFGRVSRGYSDSWSMCSTDGMVPVCSSPDQEGEMITKERRVSFPDILMSGGGASSPAVTNKRADRELPPTVDQLSYEETLAERERTANQSLTEAGSDEVADDCDDSDDNNDDDVSNHGDDFSSKECEALHKILKLPFNLHKLLSESRQANQSVWSVDSIGPYVPNAEWMMKNGLLTESQRVPENVPEDENEGVPENVPEDENEGVPENQLEDDANVGVPQEDRVPDGELDNHESLPQEETSLDMAPHQISLDYVKCKRKMAPYVHSEEWLTQNGVLESDVIIEKTEVAQNGNPSTQNGSPTVPQEDGDPDNELDENESLLCEDTTFSAVPHYTSSDYIKNKRKMNESVWSVESLAPYICSKEWLIRNGILEPNVIVEVPEGGQDGGLSTQNGSLAMSQEDRVPDNELDENESFTHEETIHDVTPQQMSFNYVQIKRKLNESVWSVESMAPYIPSKEWLIQHGVSDLIPEEVNGDIQDGGVPSTQNDSLTVKATKERRWSRLFSLSSVESFPTYAACWQVNPDNVCQGDLPASSEQNSVFSNPADELSPKKRPEMLPPSSEQYVNVILSTPSDELSPEKRPEMESEIVPSEQKEAKPGRVLDMETEEEERGPLASPTPSKSSASVPSEEEGENGGTENGSSEPEACESPNQECLCLTEQLERGPCTPEILPCNPVDGEKGSSIGQLIPTNQEGNLEPETAAHGPQDGPEAPSQPTSTQLGVETVEQRTATVNLSKGDMVDFGVQCSYVQETNCCCKKAKSSTGGNGKTGSEKNGSKMAPDILSNRGQQVGGGQQRQQTDYWRPNKARGGEEGTENGYVHRNPKRQWKNRPQNRQQMQTDKPDKPYTKQSGPRNPTHSSGQRNGQDGYYGRPGKQTGGNGANPRC